MNKNKLELFWVDKYNRNSIETRVLLEKPNLSYLKQKDNLFSEKSYYDNMLIHGDNLLALKSLKNKFEGLIKCIYIDPPYNTGAAFEHYDDNLEHSIWLSLMRERLYLLYDLLSDDGIIFVQIDDNEQAYLTVLMDEIFGRDCRINTIAVKMSEPTGVKMAHVKKRMPKLKEYILMYKKKNIDLNIVKIPKDKWDDEYKLFIDHIDKDDINFIKSIMQSENSDNCEIEKCDQILKNVEFISIEEAMKRNGISITNENKNKFRYDNSYRIVRDVATTGGAKKLADEKRNYTSGNAFLIKTPKNKIYLIKNGYNLFSEQPRIKLLFADDYLMQNPGDFWSDISTTGLEAEGSVEFKKSKKPEKLIQRCIELSTKPGDYVLDSFLGSGTTCAVAHKMRRRWIGIEMGEHAYSLAKKRIDRVIDGLDNSGVTYACSWSGGGGYKFYELAPTLISTDDFGEPVINKKYNLEMLASTVALYEGFTYNPNSECFWKQSKSNENSYLFVTTMYINIDILKQIESQMAEDEFLIIACKAYDKICSEYSNRIKLKKIPQMLLGKCEFGRDDYSLNIINPPVYEEEYDDE